MAGIINPEQYRLIAVVDDRLYALQEGWRYGRTTQALADIFIRSCFRYAFVTMQHHISFKGVAVSGIKPVQFPGKAKAALVGLPNFIFPQRSAAASHHIAVFYFR